MLLLSYLSGCEGESVEGRSIRRAGLRVTTYRLNGGEYMTKREAQSQAEIDLLPPFGEPEVHVEGSLATLAIAGAAGIGVIRAFSSS